MRRLRHHRSVNVIENAIENGIRNVIENALKTVALLTSLKTARFLLKNFNLFIYN